MTDDKALAEPENQTAPRGGFRHMPTTRIGRWAGWLAVATVVFELVMSTGQAMSRTRPGAPPFARNFGMVWLVAGLAAGVAGVIAVWHERERSWFTWGGVAMGAFMLIVLLLEVAQGLFGLEG